MRDGNSSNPVGRDSVEPSKEHSGRENPATGVYTFANNPTVVFLTVCTFKRQTGLASVEVMDALIESWNLADHWAIGDFVVMPDHLHLFCSPRSPDTSIEQWIAYWKRTFRRKIPFGPKFQSRGFHHRLRKTESYDEKLAYMFDNPVRAGLAASAAEWPYQGKLSPI